MKKTRYIPYGYTIRNGRTVVEHTEADIIREIFRNYTEGASLKDIADMLTKRQIPYTEKTSVWDKARIARIIDNGKYTGNEEYDPIIDIELYDHAVRMKMARQTYQAKTDCEGLAVIRPRIKCEKCNSPMIRHIRSRDRIKENWTCTNPECGMMVRISDGHLLEKITVLMNRIIENSKLLIPTLKEKHKDSPTVAHLQMDIESEINGGHPSEEYIIEKIGSIASELYRENSHNCGRKILQIRLDGRPDLRRMRDTIQEMYLVSKRQKENRMAMHQPSGQRNEILQELADRRRNGSSKSHRAGTKQIQCRRQIHVPNTDESHHR